MNTQEMYTKIFNKTENMNGMKLLILNLEKVSLQEQKVPVSYNSKLDLVNVGNQLLMDVIPLKWDK